MSLPGVPASMGSGGTPDAGVAPADPRPGATAPRIEGPCWPDLSGFASILAILALGAALAGCAAAVEKNNRNERWYDAMVEPLQSEPERALRFYDRIIRLKGSELARELETTRQGYEREKTELGRVELAMILSLPGAPFRDDHAAAQLLQPYARDRSLEQSPLRPLAMLLSMQLAENRKQEEALQQQVARTKDEQKKADDLQQKLDALLDMEKKLIEREQTIPTKKK
jgi:hypothetical protein